MNNYYELTDKTIEHDGRTLHRIRATQDIKWAGVRKGDLGGYIEVEENLSGGSWVTPEARVYGNARVLNQSLIKGAGEVFDNAFVSASMVSGWGRVAGVATVMEGSTVADGAHAMGAAVIKECSKVLGRSDVRGTVCGASRVDGETVVGHGAVVSGGACVSGPFVLKDVSHCSVHSVSVSGGSVSLTLARGAQGQPLVCVHGEGIERNPVALDALSVSGVLEGAEGSLGDLSYGDVASFVGEVGLGCLMRSLCVLGGGVSRGAWVAYRVLFR